jgi:transcriptional regulator with XRE-family HTH domain
MCSFKTRQPNRYPGYEGYMSKRTDRVLVSPEGRVLKRLREKHGLSMKQAGKAIGYSDSYISQIENGRADSPKGEKLKPFLDLYGQISSKYFYDLCRSWTKESTDEDFILENVGKLSRENQKLVKAMIETMLAKK